MSEQNSLTSDERVILLSDKRESAFDVLDRAAINHKPRAFWALFSGGHDSLATTAVAMEWAKLRGIKMAVAHINTGIGIPETNEFVRQTCRDQGWSLRELRPPRSYESLVCEFGFPGPGNHAFPYQRLKERCLEQLVRESKTDRRDRVMLVTGVRREESARRMRHVERIQREGATVWAAALWNWTKADCNREIERQGLARNPVVDLLHMSGECLCGAFAGPDELKEIAGWYPKVALRIQELERKVEAAGHPACRWGKRPPRVVQGNLALFDGRGYTDRQEMLCLGCEQRGAAIGVKPEANPDE